ncbi:MAG: DNA/RNA non-specific endonuclease [Desulfovibrio sp.]|uniref:hypothetical protein n=1 Tax=Desulfovibrio sp. TaxID=885 RepID=UPI0039E3BA5F
MAKLEYKTQDMAYVYFDSANNKIQSGTEKVATGMKVEFENNADINGGSKPQNGQLENIMTSLRSNFNEDTYKRGHLLNDHLGGPGKAHNLFPITAKANKEHSDRVEEPLKKLVLNPIEEPGQKRKRSKGEAQKNQALDVKYSVTIRPKKEPLSSMNPNATIECSYTYTDANDKRNTPSCPPINSEYKGRNIFYSIIEKSTCLGDQPFKTNDSTDNLPKRRSQRISTIPRAPELQPPIISHTPALGGFSTIETEINIALLDQKFTILKDMITVIILNKEKYKSKIDSTALEHIENLCRYLNLVPGISEQEPSADMDVVE